MALKHLSKWDAHREEQRHQQPPTKVMWLMSSFEWIKMGHLLTS